MKLEKAIEILEDYSKKFHPKTDFDYAQAVKLGIEALYRIEKERLLGNIHPNDSLKGETEE